LLLTETLPSVAAAPADPAAWDRWFGELNAFAEGDAEARARARKAAALAPGLGALYREVRLLREAPTRDRKRVTALQAAAAGFPDEWLLQTELRELTAE
jgi:phenylalanine-4-hydroxylase